MNIDEDHFKVFRIFAKLHPVEAAESDWPAFVRVVREENEVITEEEIRQLLKEAGEQAE